ncbi:hypothetical protein KP509_36G058100 [Ceratopteris richardii]|uniref:Protein kinase domain-containing protein n=1 Tax=Ceratopteris richardii TaxID=49495 RepID=A0A8T2QC16_CERRI|nr:hypothetical protein KP509_36G058100 [Ceratopteris richardii]
MSYGSSNMDDNDHSTQALGIDSKDKIRDNKHHDSWNVPRTNSNRNSPPATLTSGTVNGLETETAEAEIEDGRADNKDEDDHAKEDDLSLEEHITDFDSSVTKSAQDCGLTGHSDDEVVDVSPNGLSLDTLNSFISKCSAMSHVKGMYIYDNTFTVLPRSVKTFTNLRSLKIFSNEVRILPEEVGSIDVLEHLQMKISPGGLGKLPSLGKLRFLKTLELHQTPPRPILSLPAEISKLQLLKRLAICNFSISFLPAEIGDLGNLEELDLSFNKLRTLPKEISNLSALKHFRAENNKLIELPLGFAQLPNLNSVDVAHNKLTALESLGLHLMTSLRVLNAEFNKIRSVGQIPSWITCRLEGNPLLHGERTSSSDGSEEILDAGDDVSCPNLLPQKETVFPKNGRHVKTRRGWKRQNIQQLQARQDRLNLSRNLKAEVMKNVNDVISMRDHQIDMEEQTGRSISIDPHDECLSNGTEADILGGGAPQNSICGQDECSSDTFFTNSRYDQKNHEHFVIEGSVVDDKSVQTKTCISNVSSRNLLSGDGNNGIDPKENTYDGRFVDEGDGKTSTSQTKLELKTAFICSRRKGGSPDRNPKPAKRRRSVQALSEISCTYRTKSILGFDDYLQDGFYDGGRDHPFVALEVLENQHPSFESREIILVDRDRDEELDVIALSAQSLLTKLELGGENGRNGESSGLSSFQKAMMLSLFVSDCFGGSDKTLNVTNARRAALGGYTDVPFLCSCSSTIVSSISNSDNNYIQNTVPTMHQLCEDSVRLLKAQRQSNVLPLGLLPYGVCRHRAILFKYLCDRASLQCELVRGYLDYVPHAWNVVLVKKADSLVRMLVDPCRPLDIREERDPEYFCRYIPVSRFQLPSQDRSKLDSVSKDIIPVLFEEIGRGASGSVVHKCTLGPITAAVKVLTVDQSSEKLQKEALGRYLSELRIFCSLIEHPQIVSFYGHEIKCGSLLRDGHKYVDDMLELRLFMEYIPGISLEMVLARHAKEGRTYAPVKQAAYISKAVAHALSYIHSKGIVHRDIKSSNVLIDVEGKWEVGAPPVKLCDFDSAVPLISSSAHSCYLAHRGIPTVQVCVGTPRWMAPEVFQAMYNKQPYGLEADMWSFGCLIFELLTLEVPYMGLSEGQIHSYIQMGRRPPLPAKFNQLMPNSSEDEIAAEWSSLSDKELKILRMLVSLFMSCTESSASCRPTAPEVLDSLTDLLDTYLSDQLDVEFDSSDKNTQKVDSGKVRDTSSVDIHRTFESSNPSPMGKVDAPQTS